MEHLRREPKNLVFASILFALVLWAFLPTLENGFIGYDDPEYVTGNAHVQQGLTLQNVRWAFCTSAASNWHPVTWLSHMVDCDLFGAACVGAPSDEHPAARREHHSGLLSTRRLVADCLGEFSGAQFSLGLHPLRVESVAWVSERKDVLSGLFFLLTLFGLFQIRP